MNARRQGMSVRCVRKAAQKPMTSVAAVTVTVNSSVCHSKRGDQRSAEQPARRIPAGLAGLHHHEHQRAAHDDRDRRRQQRQRERRAGGPATHGRRADRLQEGGLAHERRPTLCNRSSACLPSPRSVAGTTGPSGGQRLVELRGRDAGEQRVLVALRGGDRSAGPAGRPGRRGTPGPRPGACWRTGCRRRRRRPASPGRPLAKKAARCGRARRRPRRACGTSSSGRRRRRRPRPC